MCFGNQVEKTTNTNANTTGTTAGTSLGSSTGTSSGTTAGTTAGSTAGTSMQTTAMPEWLTNAARGNLDFATALQQRGFQPYTGSQVAPFSDQQQESFGLGNQVAGGVAPYVGQTGALLSNYANAGPGRVQASPIFANMSPYMNQYVMQALAPQLDQLQKQFDTQNKGFDAQAAGAGAFGDTGWGLGRTNLTQQQDTARTGLIGNAYNTAFNTAIGAGAQDAASKLNAQTTNANLREQALARQLGGANALYGQGTGATNLLNTLGGQQTAQGQAGLNALYNQWLMSQQYPFQTMNAANAALGAARGAAPITTTGATTGQTAGQTTGQQTGQTAAQQVGQTTGATTGTNVGTNVTSQPDNSGFGMLGTALGALGGSFIGMPWLGAGLGGALGGAIGGGGGSGATSGGGGPFFAAEGGSPPVGRPSVVGERGPELFVPLEKGVVIPNDVLRAAMAKRDQAKLAAVPGLARALGVAA